MGLRQALVESLKSSTSSFGWKDVSLFLVWPQHHAYEIHIHCQVGGETVQGVLPQKAIVYGTAERKQTQQHFFELLKVKINDFIQNLFNMFENLFFPNTSLVIDFNFISVLSFKTASMGTRIASNYWLHGKLPYLFSLEGFQ